MDFTYLPLAHTPNSYGFDAELSSGSYGTPGGISQLPRSLSSGLGLQSSSFAQSPAPNLPGEQLPWPQRVLSEIQDLLLLLSPDGIVNYVSPSCSAITGFDTAQLEHDHLSRFIHDEEKAVFTLELNECITTARPLRCHFRMYQVDNSTCLMEAYGHPHLSTLNNDVIQQHFCHGVFLVCRPYHTQSTQLLDSFLEHKLENVRLKERIAQLKRDEENDLNATAQQTNLSQAHSSAAHRPVPQASKTFSTAQLGHSTLASLDPSMIYGEDNESSDTLGNVDDLDVNQAKPILNEEGTSHLNGIELMTGLFLTEGERSQGISTGAPEGHLYHFTGGNPPLEPQVPPRNEPRKKLKGEYRCADCGTSDSPEWRKGPGGPKTLCNACGLRWAKKKKRQVLG